MNKDILKTTKETADLAKLSLSEEELSSFSKDMEAIVSFAKKVAGAASNEKKPSPATKSVLRRDCPKNSFSKKKLLATAPEGSICDNCFTVPKTVE